MDWTAQHFTENEFVRSSTAEREGIDNTLPPELRPNLLRLAARMDYVRNFIGSPVLITSGYRCPKLNRYLRGKPKSQHREALAADFVCPMHGGGRRDLREIVRKINDAGTWGENLNLLFDQLILEKYDPRDHTQGWIHLSIPALDAPPRMQALVFTGRRYYAFERFKWGQQ